MQQKQESFMRGAFVLSFATLISRVLGAVYKPIVARLFAPFDGLKGDAGMGLTQIPLSSYQVIISFTSVGFNIAISRLIAERLAVRDARGAERIFRISLWFMGICGAVGTLLFWVGAPLLARAVGRSEATPGFMATAPAILLVSLMAAYRGLFQGFQRMTPNAISQIYEQVIRVCTGIVLVWTFARHSIPQGAAGFNAGDGVGALAGLIYLFLLYRRNHEHLWALDADLAAGQDGGAPEAWPPIQMPEASTWAIIKKIVVQSLPISLIGAVLPLIMWTDSFLVIHRLALIGITDIAADADFGRLTNAFAIVNLPAIITSALYVSLVPAIAEALAVGNHGQVRSRSITAFRITMLFAVPSTLGIYALADPIYRLLYGGDGGPVLMAMAAGTLFLMAQQVSSGVLQGAGKLALPVRNLIIAVIFKMILTYWLTALPKLGVLGAAYATDITFAVAAALNLWDVHREVGSILDWSSMVIKPGLAGLAMTLVIYVGQLGLTLATHSSRISAVAMMGVGAVAYGLVLVLLGGLTERDFEMVPRIGTRLASLLKRYRLLRA